MLLQLEVKNDLGKVLIVENRTLLASGDHLTIQLFSRQFLCCVHERIFVALTRALREQVSDSTVQGVCITILVHFLQDFLPHPVLNLAILDRVEHLLDVFLALEGELVLEHDLDEAD